ncbi:TnsD family Tn7-like transposition protein [Massilia putida]|uniref:TnsD family Tn7-like transposition protein n=1 Tax=Massilia putida TaxID=1141883 RepID=UPI0022773244|nr:TnsD family Tn7-like transposition protein [Massilia putida]
MPRPRYHGWDTTVAEETVFGIVSRYHRLSGNQSSRESNFDLTEDRDARLSAWFPSNLPKVLGRLNLPFNSVDDLINRHTTMPYFKLFATALNYEKAFNNLRCGRAMGAKPSLGLIFGGVDAKNILRFCPECGRDDREVIGVETWYRVHQLPGVLICPYHGCVLKVFTASLMGVGRYKLFLPGSNQANDDCIHMDNNEVRARLLLIARLSCELLLKESVDSSSDFLRNQYLMRLREKGLAVGIVCNQLNAFKNRFSEFWSPLDNLEPFSSLLQSCREPKSWLTRLFHKRRSSIHPLKHLLLVGFLSNSVSEFLAPSTAGDPNQMADPSIEDSYNVDQKIRMLHKGGMTPAQIAVEVALSAGAVRMIEERAGEPFKQRPWKLHSHVRSEVHSALAAGETLSDIARSANVSVSSVCRLLHSDPNLEVQRSSSVFKRRRTLSRNKLLAAIADFAPRTLSELNAILVADFAWLYRHDNEWLIEQTRLVGLHPSCKPLVDWDVRDALLVDELRLAISEILSLSDPLVQLRRIELIRRINHPTWITFGLNRLPNTNKLLDETIETDECFRQRCQIS